MYKIFIYITGHHSSTSNMSTLLQYSIHSPPTRIHQFSVHPPLPRIPYYSIYRPPTCTHYYSLYLFNCFMHPRFLRSFTSKCIHYYSIHSPPTCMYHSTLIQYTVQCIQLKHVSTIIPFVQLQHVYIHYCTINHSWAQRKLSPLSPVNILLTINGPLLF